MDICLSSHRNLLITQPISYSNSISSPSSLSLLLTTQVKHLQQDCVAQKPPKLINRKLENRITFLKEKIKKEEVRRALLKSTTLTEATKTAKEERSTVVILSNAGGSDD